DGPFALLGLADSNYGPVLIAWDEARANARHPERGHDVVLHEFAHKLDMLDNVINGTPPLHRREDGPDWHDVCTRQLAPLRAGAGRTAGPAAPVPTGPEWTAADLLAHISRVHRWVTEIVESKAQERVGRSNLPEPGEGDDPVEWFEAGAAVVVTALETIDPDTPGWTGAAAAPGALRFRLRAMPPGTARHPLHAAHGA